MRGVSTFAFRWVTLTSLVALAACGGEESITGPFTAAGGRVTFVPRAGVTLRGATLRLEEPASPNDTREIPGSGFWFDPGKVSLPESTPWTTEVGTLIASYADLSLPAGTAESSLRLAFWSGEEWLVLSGSIVNLGDRTVEVPVPAEWSAGWYALVSPRGMYVRIEEDPFGNFAGDSLRVSVASSSDVPISSISATVLQRSTTLEPESPFSTYRYVGWIPLDGVPRGQYVVRATATRVDGLALTDTMVFSKNYEPVVTVSEPLPGATVGQSFRARATCADDDPGGCKSLELWVHRESGEQAVLLATGTSSIDRGISLGGRVGGVVLTFSGTDQAGQKTWYQFTVRAQ